MSAHHTFREALLYASLGWMVLPLHNVLSFGKRKACSCGRASCTNHGKHPRSRGNLWGASKDQTKIRRWARDWPSLNIGILTGPESGIWMFGPDGEAGIACLAEMEREHGKLPLTPLARSGGGGRHYVFRWPFLGGLVTGANFAGLPFDVRATGGQFVAPPSLHASGRRYSWEISPSRVEAANAPHWLLTWLRGAKPTNKPIGAVKREKTSSLSQWRYTESYLSLDQRVEERARKYARKCLPAVSGQGGHNRTFAVARAICWGFSLGWEQGLRVMMTEYNPSCVPPWTEEEMLHKCVDASTLPCNLPQGWLLEGRRAIA